MTHDPLKGLPHSYPFRFIDRVLEMNEFKGVAIKNLTVNEGFFQGHFPGTPIMPGVLIIEALAQLAGLVMNHAGNPPIPPLSEGGNGGVAYIARVKDMRFKRPVQPGETMHLTAELSHGFSGLAEFAVKAEVDKAIVAQGEIVMAGVE
ncbi:MAG: 3-hydroxyacyl-ACP dehydratase FabZ [Deltaproteobacteria bacterium]|nr:3-hydroxyacyl-ACP dehydratase FabZ [Deltaproteobacteria bacterium]